MDKAPNLLDKQASLDYTISRPNHVRGLVMPDYTKYTNRK